ncbi:unnamed protein product [Adineta steineri]|uniref:Uncharacterized protein n=1 Tax=Adineta steineri TaxID=433720 RepID=A0A814PSB1_9BILA|nr:unnamed protein product [Adineta steineri]
MCEQTHLPNCHSSNYYIENDDWRPSQEILLTRFGQIEYSDMFRTINQDYGSFYYHPPVSSCIPDVLTEKIHRRQERFMNWREGQTIHRHELKNFSPQCDTQTVKITHRKKLSTCDFDELIINFLVKEIQQRLKDLIDPNDYHDVFNCAKILIIDLLSKEPSLCAEDVINRVIGIMNTPFCSINTNANITTNECYPITPPSSSFLPFSN